MQNSKEPQSEAQPNGSAPCNMMTNLFGRQQDIANASLGQSTCENNTDNSFYPTIYQEPYVANTLPVQVSSYTVGLTNQRKHSTFPEKSTSTTKLLCIISQGSKPKITSLSYASYFQGIHVNCLFLTITELYSFMT